MDEKGFIFGVQHKVCRVFNKDQWDHGSLKGAVQDSSRKWITILATIYQDGIWIKPSIIYKAQPDNFQDI